MNKKFCQYGVTIENCCRDTDCIDCTKGVEECEKPPLGLKPRWVHDEQRMNAILNAMERFTESNKAIPKEWIAELGELCIRNWKGTV